MANYKLVIQYDGTPFSGFQAQKNQSNPTIQDEIQGVLSQIFNKPIKVITAGRTDAGVHAIGQVINFHVKKEMPLPSLLRALNSLLHEAVSVSSVEIAPPDFHSRYSAKSRKYVYILDTSPHPSALWRNRTYWHPRPLDIKKMKEAIIHFRGEHDFSRFAKRIKDIENRRRKLIQADILSGAEIVNYFSIFNPNHVRISSGVEYIRQILIPQGDFIYFYFEGQAFLHSMVRLMVGNLIEVGLGNLSPGDIKKMLEPDFSIKSNAANIPGQGLYLVGVEY